MSENKTTTKFDHLKWIEMPVAKEKHAATPKPKDKLFQNVKENPIGHIGILAATACCFLGFKEFLTNGSKEKQNMYMRGRVISQAIAVVFLCAGFYKKTKTREQQEQQNKSSSSE